MAIGYAGMAQSREDWNDMKGRQGGQAEVVILRQTDVPPPVSAS